MGLSGITVKLKNGITPFQLKVFDIVTTIPSGKVSTYKYVAEGLGCKSYRAIGNALRKNPYAPEVPCHRVIRSDLSIGGYAGCTTGVKIKKKLSLLKKEGVNFKNGKLVDSENLFIFKCSDNKR